MDKQAKNLYKNGRKTWCLYCFFDLEEIGVSTGLAHCGESGGILRQYKLEEDGCDHITPMVRSNVLSLEKTTRSPLGEYQPPVKNTNKNKRVSIAYLMSQPNNHNPTLPYRQSRTGSKKSSRDVPAIPQSNASVIYIAELKLKNLPSEKRRRGATPGWPKDSDSPSTHQGNDRANTNQKPTTREGRTLTRKIKLSSLDVFLFLSPFRWFFF